MGRIAGLVVFAIVACGGERSTTRESTSIERAIENEVGVRAGVPVRARCVWMPPRCRVTLPDGGVLDVRVFARGGELEWELEGALVIAADVEEYLRETLAEMGAPQVARCGLRIRAVAVGERVECALQNGGRAFAVVHGDGTTMIEIVLDPAAGAARSEVVRDDELEQMSNRLRDEGGDGE